MLEKNDRERITALLKATICLLCKNGIAFKEKFTIDAVIGVTVDDTDVILVSMNELIQAASAQNSHRSISPEATEDGERDAQRLVQVKGRKRRRRHLSCDIEVADKHHHDDGGGEDTDDGGDLGISLEDSPDAARSPVTLSNENSRSSADLVFVKQETMDENWPHSGDALHRAGVVVGGFESKARVSSTSAERLRADNSPEQQSWLSPDCSSATVAPLFIVDAFGHNDASSGDNNNKTIHRKRTRRRLQRLHQTCISRQVINQRHRKTYSTAFKLEVIKYAEEHGGNRAAQRRYGVNEKCIRSWRKEKQRFAAEYEASINTGVT